MKGVIIQLTEVYTERAALLRAYYMSRQHTVTVIASDYSHRSKCRSPIEGTLSVPVMAYKRNLSVRRLVSHVKFAKDAVKVLESLQPDFIHALIPGNALVRELAKYKARYPHTKLIFDVNDLWPETMPMAHVQWLFPFQIWKNLRDGWLEKADQIYTECDLFKDYLAKIHPVSMDTLYWAKEQMPIHLDVQLQENELHFCYLGSINHIIDIDCIEKLLGQCQTMKPTCLHIIGKGESKDQLVACLQRRSVRVIDHGTIFDPIEKQKVFSCCHYALNVMKTSVVVGLTTKSLDYMCGQVPLINTIAGDTWRLCQTRNIGWNVDAGNINAVARAICKEDVSIQIQRRKEIENVYLEYFTKESFFHTLDHTSVLNR